MKKRQKIDLQYVKSVENKPGTSKVIKLRLECILQIKNDF